MFERGWHATIVPSDPPRATAIALWPSDPDAPVGDDAAPVELVLPDGDGTVARVLRSARHLPIGRVLDELVHLRHDDPGVSPSVRAWAVAARDAVDVVARGRIHPAISPGGWDAWALGPLDERDHERRRALADWLPPTAHCLASDAPGRADHDGPAMLAPGAAIAALGAAIADVLPRTAAAGTVSRQPAWCSREPIDVSALASHLAPADGSSRWIVGLRLHLDEVPVDPTPTLDTDGPAVTGSTRAAARVDVQLRSPDDPGTVLDAAELWAGGGSFAGADAEADLLLALRRGARRWAPLGELLDHAAPSRLELDDGAALDLLGPMAAELAAVGIEVLVPRDLVRPLRTRAHVAPSTRSDDDERTGEERTGRFDLASVCELTWRATVDGEPLSEDELSELAAASRPLVRLRGRWIVLDPEVVARLERTSTITGADAVAAALGGEITVDRVATDVEVEGPAAALAEQLRRAAEPHELSEPAGLLATLRPYQRRGLAWLDEMTRLGLGGLLADDMGLGKTVQVIALHLHRLGRDARPGVDATPAGQRSAPGPTLVVCPATLLGNWERELARFAPGVATRRYHGPERSLEDLGDAEVVMTSYGIARRDHERLGEIRWGLVVADEAQQVKNPASATARALRSIPADARVGLTGTPVENRLGDLWALLDWTTPGLLGSHESFRRNVAIPVERDRDPVATERFTRLVAPFLLRRRKDDPAVAPDLPPKTETDHPVALSAEQASLYRATVEELLASIESADGISRRGLVLKLLTSLKQICNHPAHHLGQTGPLAGRSGKLDAFDDLVTAIVDAGDATLVFTQYVVMGELLMARLEQLGVRAEFLHGSLSVPRRTEMVDRFQAGDHSVFVISLRAGGTGLNLTAATHVIHYDRWWNPAVENQASDRAWRIGQDRPVQIHRLISDGTVEDRIAKLLTEKQALADAVVGGGEAWLTELDDAALGELVRLGEDGA